MSRAAFSAFSRNFGRFQTFRAASMKGVPSMMFKAKPMGSPISVAFPEMMAKNQRITQLVKMAKQSTRLCTLQLQKVQVGAISVLLTGAGSILIDFEDMINSLEDEEDEELLRRTSLLVQTQRGG
ncbi:hypothetical protein WA556_000182 [Blastocystis sp. ATCC 50177/Nand II]